MTPTTLVKKPLCILTYETERYLGFQDMSASKDQQQKTLDNHNSRTRSSLAKWHSSTSNIKLAIQNISHYFKDSQLWSIFQHKTKQNYGSHTHIPLTHTNIHANTTAKHTLT